MRYTPRLAALSVALGLLATLPACAAPSADSSIGSVRETDATDGTATDLRAHYDALVIALQEELAELRTDAYITTETLLARIEALESALDSLSADVAPADSDEISLPSTESPPDASIGGSADAPSVPAGSDAAETAPAADSTSPAVRYTYTVSDGAATVTGYTADSAQAVTRLTVPETLGGFPVTAIADYAFAGTEAETVVLPATLTRIGWFAFADCTHLQTVILPASVEHIDYGAFDGCTHLTVYCPRASYAARYAAAWGIACVEA